MKRIMIVDDEADIRQVVRLYLENAGYQVIEAANGKEALDKLKGGPIDLMVLDIMMPAMDGYELIRVLGQARDFPIIFLSAKASVQERIQGLNMGGDDYLTKPFDPGELLARVMALLRRQARHEEKAFVENGPLAWDQEKRQIYLDGSRLDLTAKEYQLLAKFILRPGKVFTKAELYEDIWEEVYYHDDNTIMVHISKLRDKIEKDPKNPQIIQTIRGLGYMMVDYKDEG